MLWRSLMCGIRQSTVTAVPSAVSYPFIYTADDRIDLAGLLERHFGMAVDVSVVSE